MTQEFGDEPVKVLFLAGKGRSGGTLLASLLGQLPGFFNIGELNRLWDWGLVSNFRCGCGLPVQDCPTWDAILEAADASLAGTGIAPIAQARIDLAQHEVVRWPNTGKLLRARPATRDRWGTLERYTNASSAVYRAIAHVTGARVVVDSSRLPIEPVALGLVPDVDVRVAQVIRDPRAVVYSWKRSKPTTDRDNVEYMPKFSAAFSTTSWLARNLVVEVIGRRRKVEIVQYDEMARDPAATLRKLAAFVGEPAGDLAFLTSESATIAPTHSVGGNPVRMTSGAISIKPDEEWRGDISPRDRAVGTTIALPLLHRYGLPVRSGDATTRPTLTTNAWLRFDTIRHDLRTAKPKTVLEVGAGEGGLGSWLAANYEYTGVEPDERSRTAANARLATSNSRIVENLEAVGDQQFDAVCAFEVLEHIGEDQKALEQWREHLRPDGWLLLSVPAHQSDYGVADKLVGHYRRYEQSTLTDVLNHAGFEVVRLSSYGAGLGQVLQRARNTVAKRVAAKQANATDTPEERSSGSGRFMQPRQKAAALVFAAVAAPGRLAQRPFARTNIGTGYVVLARRSE